MPRKPNRPTPSDTSTLQDPDAQDTLSAAPEADNPGAVEHYRTLEELDNEGERNKKGQALVIFIVLLVVALAAVGAFVWNNQTHGRATAASSATANTPGLRMLQLSDFSAGWTENDSLAAKRRAQQGCRSGNGDFENLPYSIQESLYSFPSVVAAEQGTENALNETEGNFGYAPMSFPGVKTDQVFRLPRARRLRPCTWRRVQLTAADGLHRREGWDDGGNFLRRRRGCAVGSSGRPARHNLGHRPRSESALWQRHPGGGRSPST